jgi:hypothetical protein
MVTKRGRSAAELVLSENERRALLDWSSPDASHWLGLRSRIILECAEGRTNLEVAESLKLDRMTVGRWRTRFATQRIAGLVNESRPGRSVAASPGDVEAVLVATLTRLPPRAARWSQRSMAVQSGLSASTVGRIWREFGLAPHDAQAIAGLTELTLGDVVGLFLDPPHRTVAIASGPAGRVDWSRVGHQRPASWAEKTHPLTELLTALRIARTPHDRPRCPDAFSDFLEMTLSAAPSSDVHLVCDGITRPVRLPGVHVHAVSSSAWVNVVGPWLPALARAVADDGASGRPLCSWSATVDTEPSAFVWTRSPLKSSRPAIGPRR